MSFTKRYDAKQKKDSIGMITALLEKIQSGKFKVVSSGFWESGLDNKWTFRVIAKLLEKNKK